MIVNVCNQRDEANRNANVKDVKMGKDEDSVQIMVQGLVAEYAFCKKFNLFCDLSSEPRSGTYDIKSRDGKRIDIKSTRIKNGNLVRTLKENNDVDIYVLAIVHSFSDIHFVGWIEKENFIKPDNITDLGHGKTYFLNKNYLKMF